MQIQKTEEAIKSCYERVDSLENKLRNETNSEQEDDIRKQLAEVRKLLATNEELLSGLHKHNRTSFVFAIALCFVVFVVYMLYILVAGYDF